MQRHISILCINAAQGKNRLNKTSNATRPRTRGLMVMREHSAVNVKVRFLHARFDFYFTRKFVLGKECNKNITRVTQIITRVTQTNTSRQKNRPGHIFSYNETSKIEFVLK